MDRLLKILDRRFGGTDYGNETNRCIVERLRGKTKVLELGVGFGNLAKALLDDDSTRLFYGVDIEPAAINYARRKLEGYSVERVTLEVMDARDLQYPQDYFDGVASASSLGEIGELERTFKGVFKTLCQGGTFLFTTATDDAIARFQSELLEKLCESAADTAYVKAHQPNRPLSRFTYEDIIDALRRAGFVKNLEFTPFYHNSCGLYTIEK